MADDPITYNSWDGDSANGIDPHRPSVANVGDNDKENKPGQPNDPRYGYTAEALNQRSTQIAAIAKVTDAAIITVEFSSGTPVIVKAIGPSTAIVDGTPFTVTDNGTGDTSIEWTSSTFPPFLRGPRVSIGGTTPGMPAVEEISNGVRVRTFNSAGAATDLPFTVDVG